jgi:hypothetical protein
MMDTDVRMDGWYGLTPPSTSLQRRCILVRKFLEWVARYAVLIGRVCFWKEIDLDGMIGTYGANFEDSDTYNGCLVEER